LGLVHALEQPEVGELRYDLLEPGLEEQLGVSSTVSFRSGFQPCSLGLVETVAHELVDQCPRAALAANFTARRS